MLTLRHTIDVHLLWLKNEELNLFAVYTGRNYKI